MRTPVSRQVGVAVTRLSRARVVQHVNGDGVGDAEKLRRV